MKDLEQWRDLQRWLAGAEHRVTIPYAKQLVEQIKPIAVRMRRDVAQLLALIRAHAVLHQATRARDEDGRIIATLADYKVVRDLVSDVMAEGVSAALSQTVRETVEAVDVLSSAHPFGVTVNAVAAKLGLDKSNASRRLRVAAEDGYLPNREDKRGKPARWEIGDPLPETMVLLPDATQLATVAHLSDQGLCEPEQECCAVAPESEGYRKEGYEGYDEAVALVHTVLGGRVMDQRATTVAPFGGRGALTATAYALTTAGGALKPDAHEMRQRLKVVSRRTPAPDHFFTQFPGLEDRIRARMMAAESMEPPPDDGEDG